MTELTGKVAWVTGAGSGIGRAVAVALAGEGAAVALSGRREAVLADTAAEIERAGGKALAVPLDVADREAARRAAGAIHERLGSVGILVNNAGVNVSERHWHNPDLEQWDRLIKTNLNGVYYTIAAVLPAMRQGGDGLIVNIASWAGRYNSYVAGVAYGASKHAVLALNASLNMEECRHGIRACAICPAEVATPILDKRPVPVSQDERTKMLQPEDLAETVLYVARLPARACVNEILISPTANRFFLGTPDVPPAPER